MKKAIILAVTTIGLISFSVVFYYKKTDFSNGGEYIVAEKNIAQNTNEKKSWFNLSFNTKEEKSDSKHEENSRSDNLSSEDKIDKNSDDFDNVKNTNVVSKDLSICNENGKIMVLMYHKFAEKSTDGWTRSLSDFKKDLQLLYDKNYYPINMNDYIEGNIDAPYGKTPVVLTFDDGTAGQLSFEWVDDTLSVKENTAVKVYQDFVKEHPDFPMKGTFYIMSTNFFGSKGTLKQRLEYLVNLGFEIGNQTQNHYALQKAESKAKVIEEVGGLAKFVDELIPGYKISSFSIPGGSMTKTFEEQVYSGEYNGFKYENKGVVLLYGSKPALSPVNKELDLKKISRIRVLGNEKLDKDLEYWVNYFEEHPEEKFVSDGDVNTFVINAEDKDNVVSSNKIVVK